VRTERTKFYSRIWNHTIPLVSILFAIVVIDISIAKIADLLPRASSEGWKLGTFIFIVIVFCLGEFFLFKFLNRNNRNGQLLSRYSRTWNYFIKSSVLLQTSLIAFLTLQILLYHHYYSAFLFYSTVLSYSSAVISFIILSIRFIRWFRTNHNKEVFLFLIASISLLTNIIATLFLVGTVLFYKPAIIGPHPGTVFVTFERGTVLYGVNYLYYVTSIVSFGTMWLATSFLLRHHSNKWGRSRYWIVVSIPLMYFLSQFAGLFPFLYTQMANSNPIFISSLFMLLSTYSIPLGSIIFGLSFLLLSLKMPKLTPVRTFLQIAGYGITLLYISNLAIVITGTTYPPFGLAAASFVGLASFLVLNGIYYSAVSVSIDVHLRRSIANIAKRDPSMLEGIGTAEMESTVIQFSRNLERKYAGETGVKSSYDDDALKEYLQAVLSDRARKNREG
jgi:hypothetical protein